MNSTIATRCQREGRQFESGLVLQQTRAPSRCYAAGLFRFGGRRGLGAAGVPSGAAKIEEADVRFFFLHGVGVDAQGQFGVHTRV